MRRTPSHSPKPSVVEPCRELLLAVRSFVRSACTCPGVLRVALMGSLAKIPTVDEFRHCRLNVRAVLWGSRLDLGTPAIGWYFVAFLQADSRGSFASIAAMKDAGGFQAERLRAMVAIFARAGDKSANRVIISPPLWRMKYST
jgi:hypothetical protein